MHRILALWAVPRSASTAFERMMIERGDHTVFDEPFSATYYFSDERRSDRFDHGLPRSSWTDVLDDLRAAARERPVFFKDMAYHASPYLDTDALEGFVHTFLVRDPRLAIPSLARRWPDFTDEETGYGALRDLFRRVREAAGTTPLVIDADELRRSPEGVVRTWCRVVGIRFVRDALSWEPGMQPQWRLWRDWYETVAQSTGFLPPVDGEPPPVADARVAAAIDDALPLYRELAAFAGSPEG